jgi:hypothetical protein
MSTSSRAKEEAYYALMSETANLHAEVEALREQLEYQNQQQQEQSHKQHRQWIADNLEEAQRIIDNIVGIKGITEDPLKAAVKLGISSHTTAPATAPAHEQISREALQKLLMSNLTTRREDDFIAECDDQSRMPFECGH